MLSPKKSKFRKHHKGISFNKICVQTSKNLIFGSIGLQMLVHAKLTPKQLDSILKVVKKNIKKTGKIIIKGFPDTPVTKKPLETRMGKGKGNFDTWALKVKPGFILLEIITDDIEVAIKGLKIVQKKMGPKSKIIFK